MSTLIYEDLTQNKRLYTKPNTVYILTSEVNEYDQKGEYFVCVFKNKPNIKSLRTNIMEYCGDEYSEKISNQYIEHILNVGGRTNDNEYRWFYLREFILK